MIPSLTNSTSMSGSQWSDNDHLTFVTTVAVALIVLTGLVLGRYVGNVTLISEPVFGGYEVFHIFFGATLALLTFCIFQKVFTDFVPEFSQENEFTSHIHHVNGSGNCLIVSLLINEHIDRHGSITPSQIQAIERDHQLIQQTRRQLTEGDPAKWLIEKAKLERMYREMEEVKATVTQRTKEQYEAVYACAYLKKEDFEKKCKYEGGQELSLKEQAQKKRRLEKIAQRAPQAIKNEVKAINDEYVFLNDKRNENNKQLEGAEDLRYTELGLYRKELRNGVYLPLAVRAKLKEIENDIKLDLDWLDALRHTLNNHYMDRYKGEFDREIAKLGLSHLANDLFTDPKYLLLIEDPLINRLFYLNTEGRDGRDTVYLGALALHNARNQYGITTVQFTQHGSHFVTIDPARVVHPSPLAAGEKARPYEGNIWYISQQGAHYNAFSRTQGPLLQKRLAEEYERNMQRRAEEQAQKSNKN